MVKYTNIEVELQSMGTGDVLARIEAEKENPQADIGLGCHQLQLLQAASRPVGVVCFAQRGQPGRELPQQHRRQRDLLQPVRQRLLHPEQYPAERAGR